MSIPLPRSSIMAFPSVSVEEARALYTAGQKYLDVRTQEEFDDGHAPGACCVPVMLKGDSVRMLTMGRGSSQGGTFWDLYLCLSHP